MAKSNDSVHLPQHFGEGQMVTDPANDVSNPGDGTDYAFQRLGEELGRDDLNPAAKARFQKIKKDLFASLLGGAGAVLVVLPMIAGGAIAAETQPSELRQGLPPCMATSGSNRTAVARCMEQQQGEQAAKEPQPALRQGIPGCGSNQLPTNGTRPRC